MGFQQAQSKLGFEQLGLVRLLQPTPASAPLQKRGVPGDRSSNPLSICFDAMIFTRGSTESMNRTKISFGLLVVFFRCLSEPFFSPFQFVYRDDDVFDFGACESL